jgi:precorrin-4 methylase
MLVNKDQENSHAIRIAFHDDKADADNFFTGPVSVISFGSEQYQWHPDERGGKADPDGPAVRSTVAAAADTEFTLPKASLTVIRGKIAAKSSAPAKRTR